MLHRSNKWRHLMLVFMLLQIVMDVLWLHTLHSNSPDIWASQIPTWAFKGCFLNESIMYSDFEDQIHHALVISIYGLSFFSYMDWRWWWDINRSFLGASIYSSSHDKGSTGEMSELEIYESRFILKGRHQFRGFSGLSHISPWLTCWCWCMYLWWLYIV